MKRSSWIAVGAALFLTACHKDHNPADPIGSAAPQPPAGQTSTGQTVSSGTIVTTGTSLSTTTLPSGAGPAFVVFANELKSGGGAFLYPGGENQSLTFTDRSNTLSGNSIRYAWTGGDVAGQHTFAGMDLMVVPEFAQYASSTGKDLRSGHYTHVNVDVRGSLASDTILKIEVADDGNVATPAPCVVLSTSGMEEDNTAPGAPPPCLQRGQLTTTWKRFSLPVSAGDLASVKDYFKATFIYKKAGAEPGNGGAVFFDNITYER